MARLRGVAGVAVLLVAVAWAKPRARDLGIPFEGTPGPLNAITDVKGVEVGDAAEVAGRRGSEAHDAISWDESAQTYRRETNWSGGIEGGMSNGQPLLARS